MKPLRNPPIGEAVLDIRVIPADDWNPEELKELIVNELPEYSDNIEDGKEFVYKVSKDGIESKEKRFGCIGYKLTSKDKSHIVHFNQQGFVFVWQGKYKNWDSFSEKAKVFWDIYIKLLIPKRVKRVGVRFINKMQIKESPFYLKDFFVDPPKEDQIDGWELVNFHYRDSLIVPESPYTVTINKTVLPLPVSQKIEKRGIIILDIDVYFSADSECCMWENFSDHFIAIRGIKNKVFFNSITKEKIKEYI